MAQLKDTLIQGNARITDTLFSTEAQIANTLIVDSISLNALKAPTSSGGTTQGLGTSGQFLKTNGTGIYWGDLGLNLTDNIRIYTPTITWQPNYVQLFALSSNPSLEDIGGADIKKNDTIIVGPGETPLTDAGSEQRQKIRQADFVFSLAESGDYTNLIMKATGTSPTETLEVPLVIIRLRGLGGT